MQLIAADIGNSSTKVAVEHAGEDDRWSLETVIRGDDSLAEHFQELSVNDRPAFWAVSSVNQQRELALANWIATHRPDDQFHLITSDEIDLQTNVETRNDLGRDRLIAAWQATQLNEGGPLVVIDAGTAVTIDFIDDRNVFQGGMIFPGAHTALRMLASETDRLPDLATEGLEGLESRYRSGDQLSYLGKSTTSAILLGVYQSQLAAIKCAVEQLSISHGPLDVCLTGGGIQEFAAWLPESWQHIPDLVLQGAIEIGRGLVVT